MTVPVPQLDLRPQLAALQCELREAAARVVASGRFILGDELSSFEAAFAAYCGVEHAVGVASGTDALELALRALGIGPGDEVVTVAHTFVATPLAVETVGATPVFVDVDSADGLMDTACVSDAITPRTRAIMPVHLYGRCVEMGPLLELADSRGLAVVEDAAQAHGARSSGRRAGSIGRLGCFSFYPSKNLGALGDGGAVTTADGSLAERLRLLRNYGETEKYRHDSWGRNSRLDELQAAVLAVKLTHLDELNAARREVAARYRETIATLDAVSALRSDLGEDVIHQFVVRTPRRDALRRFLDERGIGTQVHYPIPCHRQEVFAHGSQPYLPRTDALAAEVLSLPMFPELTDAQVRAVCAALVEWDARAA